MGKADYKKVNDYWYSNDEDNRAAIDKYYHSDDTAKVRSKKKKKKVVRSDHKHLYEKVLLRDVKDHFALVERCTICGKYHIIKGCIFVRPKGKAYYCYAHYVDIKHMIEYKDLPIIDTEKTIGIFN